MSLGFVGNAPINVALNNHNFEVSLNETAIGQNSQFNTSSVALFDGNINSLTLDKYGRITNISTGYTLPTPNQINYLKIAGDSGSNINAQITDLSNSDTLTFTGKTGHVSTELVNKSVVTELLPTGISNSDEYTYEITNVDAGTNGLLIRKLGSNTNVTNLTLSKGKVYIFRQYDNTSTNTNSSLSTHGAGLSTSINGGNIYTEGIEYFIKDSQGVLLGPLSHTDYYNNFIVRGSNREPYFTLKLPNNAPNTLYLYSMSTPTLVNNITLNISNNIEYITYDNVNSLVVDSYGRLHSVKQTPNLDTLMTQFNIRGDDSNQIVVKHNNILDIYGQEGHIKSYVQNNNLYSRLAETKIISTDTDNVSVVIESTVDVINSAVKWYNPSTPNTTFTSLNLLKGRSYKFYQINPLNQTHGMGISTSQISVIEYTTGVEYHVVIGSVDTVVQPNDYNNYFTNPALNGSSAYILFNVPYDAPSKLYMYSRLSSIVAELELNAIGDFRKIDNVLSITVDRFGRIQDAISGVDNNRVEFIIELDGYNTLSFGLIQRSVYIQTLIAFFTVIEYSDVSLNVVDVNNKAHITTSINEISTIKSQSIIANINNLQNIANTARNFQNSLVNNGLNLLTGFTIIQAGTNISLPNNSNFSSFNVNVNSNNINISDLSTLQLSNTPPIVLTENVNNKSINFSLETLSGSSTNYTGGITELNVDTFGRVTNVVTGNSNLPLSGVTAGTYNPSISEIVVNQYGIITSITASNLPNDINNEVTRATNAENTLTTNLTNEINRATSAESTLTINLNNEITRATNAENANSTSITNETNRAIGIEGILTNLNTSNKTNLVESINSEMSRALNIENTLTTNLTNEINRATVAETTLTNNLSNEITRATGVETTINNNLNIIGPLTDYSSSNTLLSNLGNLNNIIGSKTSLLDYINSIGNIDVYNATSTLSTALGDLSNIPSGSSISEFITKYGEANLLTLAAGRKTLLEIIGNNLVNNKYSYGPSSLSYGNAFDRDGYYPLFTTTNNLNTWKNTNIVAILDDALTRVTNPSADYTNIQNFKNAFVYDVAIGHNQTINHEWNVKLSFEPSTTTQIYYTITHPSSSTNPSISFTNTSSVAETITIPLNNIGTYSNSIIGDIATLEGQVSILNTKVGVNTGGSGAGADILGKLSALGDTPNFKNTMNSRTLVSVIGELSTGVAATWNNNTILQTIGEPTKLPGSTDITTELQRLGSLNDYSSNTLISKIGNISSITTTLKDIIDALGNITATYNSGSTLLNDLYTKSQVDTKIADLIDSAPGALNTLNELAAALGDDANFSTTITTQLTNINNSISNVENTALSTWVGSTNITTLGTISTGVWQGTNLDINRINWTNKANLTALQTDLPAASNNSLIARVVGEGLYFSDGTNYKRVSNYDDVTTLLSGKQNAITAGPLTNSLTGPDFATNRVVISGGAGKLDVSAISTTQLGYLSDVTGNIGSALSGKQNTLSTGTLPLETISGLTITLSQLNTLTDVVPGNGNIQAQLNNISAGSSPFKVDNMLPINPQNIAITYQNGMSDNKLPIFNDQILKLYDFGKAWGVYTEKSGLNMGQAWRIIFKHQLTQRKAGNPLYMAFEHDSNHSQWVKGGLGGQFSDNTLAILDSGPSSATTFTINDTSSAPASYFNTTNPTYTVITRLAGGQTDIELYDHNFSLLWDTQITTVLNYNNNMIFTVYYNAIKANLLGLLVEQGNTITPDDLNKMLLMNSYVQSQIKNHRLSYHKAYFGPLIDYYVSIDSSGVIHLSGQKPQTTDPTIALGLEDDTGGASGARRIETIIPNNASGTYGNETFLTDHDGVTWFKPPHNAYTLSPGISNHVKPVLILGGIDLTNYLAHGYTICFYISNFKYASTDSNINIAYNLWALMAQLVDTGSHTIRFRHKLFNTGYDADIRDTSASTGSVTATPQISTYDYSNSNEFKYNDDTNPITGSTEDRESIWLIGISHKYGNTANNFENEPSADHKSMQFFYKRTNYNRVNSSRIWEPTFGTQNGQVGWDSEGLGRLFKDKTWFMFGTAHDDVVSGNTYATLTDSSTLYDQWTSKFIDVGGSDLKSMRCEYSEIMFLNKALTYNEFSALAELQPGDARLKFG